MKSRCLVILLILIAGALILSSCSTTAQTPEFASESTELLDPATSPPRTPTPPAIQTAFPTEIIVRGTVTIRHSWDESEIPTLAMIIKSFQQIYPDVLFDVMYLPADTLQIRFEEDTRQGIGPSLIFGPAEWGAEFYRAGLTADLSQAVNSGVIDLLNPPALESAWVDGKLVGLPYSIHGVVLYRNKDILTLAPDTFDDLVALAQASTQGAVIGANLERSFFFAGGHLIGLGGRFIDENNLPAFNNGLGVEWLYLLKSFESAGPPNYFTDDDLLRFKEGKTGWIIDGTWNLRELTDALGPDRLAIDPWPTYANGSLSGFVQAEQLYLSARITDESRVASVKFIEYLLSPEGQTLLTNSGRIPAALGVKPADPTYGLLLGQSIAALQGGAALPTSPEFALYNINLEIALRSFFEQNIPPEQALQSAQDAILAGLNQIQSTATPPP